MLRADMQIVTSGKRGVVAAAKADFAFPRAPEGTVAFERHPTTKRDPVRLSGHHPAPMRFLAARRGGRNLPLDVVISEAKFFSRWPA